MALIYSSAVNKRINLRSKRSCDNGRLSKSCHQSQTSEEHGIRLGSAEDVFSPRRHSGETSIADERSSGPSSPCLWCSNDSCKCASTSAKTSIGSCGSDHKSQKRITSKNTTQQKSSLHRSKTTCSDRNPKRKTTVAGSTFPQNVAENSRKISQPLMTSSMYAESSAGPCCSRTTRQEVAMRKVIAKKHLSRKIALDREESVDADSPRSSQSPHRDDLARCLSLHQSYFGRRRSVSVDEGAARSAALAAAGGADSSPDSYDSVNELHKKSTLQRMKNRFAKWKLST